MRLQIAGWLYIVAGAIILFSGLITFLGILLDGQLFYNGLLLIMSIVSILFALYAIILGGAIRAHKKWSWYPGVATALFALIGNIFTLVTNFSVGLLYPIALGLIILYALLTNKALFFSNAVSSNISQPQPENPPAQ